jgi:hypothetical protein
MVENVTIKDGVPRLTLICNSNIVTRIPVPYGFRKPVKSSNIFAGSAAKMLLGNVKLLF